MISQRNRQRHLATLLVGLSATVSVYGQDSGALFDPDASVPPTIYESVFPDSSGFDQLDAPQYPWKALYEPDGKFIPESTFGGTTSSSQMMSSDDMSHSDMDHGEGAEMMMSTGETDSRGVIKKIYLDDGKVKLKHGPIDRLEMPGMTMIFYVKDPSILDGLTVGEEVGFDVEMDGTAFYIIRFEQ
jgi:Cu(I)/Ag(I) efflux system protein CusF